MRPTIVEYLMLVSCICVALIVAVVAFGSSPPVPYVRIADSRLSPIYLSRIECVNGFEIQTYAREGGDEIPAVLTDRPCANDRRP